MAGDLSDDPGGQVAAVFAREVPEITSGSVVIRAVARALGIHTKVAVESGDPNVDPMSRLSGWDIDILPDRTGA